jgi:multiple sugar transport system substrate-binding protein
MTSNADRSPETPETPSGLNRRQFVGGAAVVGAGAALAACGKSTTKAADTTAAAADTTAAAVETSAAAETTVAPVAETTVAKAADTTAAAAAAGGDAGEVTFGSNFSNDTPKAAIAAAIAATKVTTKINTVDHNGYQDNFNTYIQQPDDVVSWFAGYRMKAFAAKGVVGDVSDVWGGLTPNFGDAIKKASTADDGKQYFVPLYFYPWAVHYRKSLFTEKGYTAPKDWTELLALCEKMKKDGITPFSAANDGGWPQMGMFDMINLRTNGYDFHVSLMAGKESWTDPKVMKVFENWKTILPFYQPDANSRKWEDGAQALGKKETGMYLIGTFVGGQFGGKEHPETQEIFDDLDFFAFPAIDAAHGQDAVEAPIDGFMMAKAPKNEKGAKALLAGLGSVEAINAYLAADPSVVGAHVKSDTSKYNSLQKKSVELMAASKQVAQFMDRDTDPDFASKVVGPAIKDFLSGKDIAGILKTVEEQKATYKFG